MNPTRSVEPTQEPFSLVDVKLHCRIPADVLDEDAMTREYMRAARVLFEEYTQTTAFTSTWVWVQDDFCGDDIVLPMGAPLQSVTSVKYYDTTGTQQTLATSYYRVDTVSRPGRVVLKPDQSWPDVQSDRGQAVEVTYVAGHSTAAAIPPTAKVGMYLLINHLVENRGAVQVGVGVGAVQVPWSVETFWAPERVWSA